ncbi:MAG: phosphoglycerate kinase [Chloroflexi bacterium]|nr:phosphoglycerate kinase [Chloroflexota bacterium]
MLIKQTVRDIDITNKRVLVRVDFNVPIEDGVIRDDTRIRAALPTIRYLLEANAAVILCSHLGRPHGQVVPKLSLRPVAEHLEKLLDTPVAFATDCIGPLVQAAANALGSGDVLLLENTRFHAGEQGNDPEMGRALAALAEVYVNDAFGSAHRAHASTVGVAQHLPAVAGLLMEQELEYLGSALADPKQPFIAILGGAKVSDKIAVIRHLLPKTERILIGGGMANTFFKAQGYALGDSLVEADAVETARQLLEESGKKLLLPVDIVIADDFDSAAQAKTIGVGDVPDSWRILDIGSQTVAAFANEIRSAATVVWNGPMGVFEFPRFAQGTFGLAGALAKSNALSIVGGGDSAAAIHQSGLADQITHISTGGGASLQMLAGEPLPGVAALLDKSQSA